MSIVKYDTFPCFFVNTQDDGRDINAIVDEDKFTELAGKAKFIARFPSQIAMDRFMEGYANKQGFDQDEITTEGSGRWHRGSLLKIQKTGRRICKIDENMPFESINMLIRSGKRVKLDLYNRDDIKDTLCKAVYSSTRYSIYNGGILYDNNLGELFFDQQKANMMINRKNKAPEIKVRPMFHELESLSNEFYDCIGEVVGQNYWHGSHRFGDYYSFDQEIDKYYKVFLHNIKFMERDNMHTLLNRINDMMKYNIKEMHKDRIKKIRMYIEKYKDNPGKSVLLQNHQNVLGKLLKEQKQFGEYYLKLKVIQKKLRRKCEAKQKVSE